MAGVTHFLVIDDDPVNNYICSKYLEITFPGADIKAFTDPKKGMDHISSAYNGPDVKPTIFFLDINMPVHNGWDVLDMFDRFPDSIKLQIRIYMLSSSVASEDRQRATAHKLVSGFVEKPLSVEWLQSLAAE